MNFVKKYGVNQVPAILFYVGNETKYRAHLGESVDFYVFLNPGNKRFKVKLLLWDNVSVEVVDDEGVSATDNIVPGMRRKVIAHWFYGPVKAVYQNNIVGGTIPDSRMFRTENTGALSSNVVKQSVGLSPMYGKDSGVKRGRYHTTYSIQPHQEFYIYSYWTPNILNDISGKLTIYGTDPYNDHAYSVSGSPDAEKAEKATVNLTTKAFTINTSNPSNLYADGNKGTVEVTIKQVSPSVTINKSKFDRDTFIQVYGLDNPMSSNPRFGINVNSDLNLECWKIVKTVDDLNVLGEGVAIRAYTTIGGADLSPLALKCLKKLDGTNTPNITRYIPFREYDFFASSPTALSGTFDDKSLTSTIGFSVAYRQQAKPFEMGGAVSDANRVDRYFISTEYGNARSGALRYNPTDRTIEAVVGGYGKRYVGMHSAALTLKGKDEDYNDTQVDYTFPGSMDVFIHMFLSAGYTRIINYNTGGTGTITLSANKAGTNMIGNIYPTILGDVSNVHFKNGAPQITLKTGIPHKAVGFTETAELTTSIGGGSTEYLIPYRVDEANWNYMGMGTTIWALRSYSFGSFNTSAPEADYGYSLKFEHELTGPITKTAGGSLGTGNEVGEVLWATAHKYYLLAGDSSVFTITKSGTDSYQVVSFNKEGVISYDDTGYYKLYRRYEADGIWAFEQYFSVDKTF